MEYFGFPAIPDNKISKLLPKVKAAVNIPIPTEAVRDRRFDTIKWFSKSEAPTIYDHTARYIEEMVTYLRTMAPKEALKKLFKWDLYKHATKRSGDRMKNVIKKSFAKKRGGSDFDLSMDTSFSDDDTVFEGVSEDSLDPFYDRHDKNGVFDKIGMKEIISKLYPKNSIERQILELCSQGINPTNEEISKLLNNNISPRGVGKARERIRKAIAQHINHTK
jgi:hypothetical protein